MKPQVLLLASLCALLMAEHAISQTNSAGDSKPQAAPAGSPASTIGLFVNPRNNQTPQQQGEDEKSCYETAQQQTGIDPTATAAAPTEPAKKQGGGAKGAAGGAAGGAAIGAIAGDAGTGAAIGATAGAVRGRRQQNKANKQARDEGWKRWKELLKKV